MKNKNCKICNTKPYFYSDGMYSEYESSIDLATGGWTTLKAGKDKDDKVIMYGQGDGLTEFYYPKYCPECGRKLHD